MLSMTCSHEPWSSFVFVFFQNPDTFLLAGRLGLLDYDEVELSNLHRQVLHGEENCGQAKTLSAAHAVKRY